MSLVSREEALIYHSRERKGKLETMPSKPCSTQKELSMAYTPGVAEACREIQKSPEDVYKYTNKANLVAVVSNGSAVLGLVGGLMIAAPALGLQREAEPIERTPFAAFPGTLGEWRATGRGTLSDRVARTLGADDYILTDFVHPDATAPVNFWIAWYRDQRDGGVHSPEICIPGGGWEIDALEAVPVMIPSAEGRLPVLLNRVVIRKGMSRQLAYYWFDQRGRHIASDISAKGWLLWDALTTGRSDGALIRLITPILPNESEETAEARLKGLLEQAMPVLPTYIDTDWPAPEKG